MTEFLNFSATESERFNRAIYRAALLPVAETSDFVSECMQKKADVVILRTETDQAARITGELTAKCHTIAADTLIEFRKPLSKKTLAEFLNSGAEIVEVGENERASLREVVPRCYAEYTNHYHANPCLDTASVVAGLTEFSESFLGRPDRTVFLAMYKNQPCGYLCMEIRDNVGSTVIGGSALDISLNLRHKILCDLTHHGDLWLLDRGIKRFKAVTRTDKTYIQKLLFHNMHCLPSATLGTLHINFFLTAMEKEPLREISPSESNTGDEVGAFQITRHQIRKPEIVAGQQSVILRNAGAEYRYCADLDKRGIFRIKSVLTYRA